MRKLSALLFVCILHTSVHAQIANGSNLSEIRLNKRGPHIQTGTQLRRHTAAKTTSPTHDDWYNMYDQNYEMGTAAEWYLNIYPDSNIVYPTYGFPAYYNTHHHGVGMSFDPTDSAYYYTSIASPVSAPMPSTANYLVDSFTVAGRYIYNNPDHSVTDSLVVDFIITADTIPDSGAYNLALPPNPLNAGITADLTPRYATATYTRSCYDAFPSILAHKQRYAFSLNYSSSHDTDINGDTPLTFELPSPLHVYAGSNVVAFVHFVSGVSYPLGTSSDSANMYHIYVGEPNGLYGWWHQSASNPSILYRGSYQDGLIALDNISYTDTGFMHLGHNVLIPSYSLTGTTAPGFDVPLMGFHVIWPDTSGSTTRDTTYSFSPIYPLNTQHIPSVIKNVTAYPVPVQNELNIQYTLGENADVTVTLLNVLGTVVRLQDAKNVSGGMVVFNTSDIASGVYLYMVCTSGQKQVGRVVVSH